MKIGFHTDAFNSAAFSFEKALQWAKKNDVHSIEPGVIDGVSWIHGLGYQPHVALWEDPLALRRKMEREEKNSKAPSKRMHVRTSTRHQPGTGLPRRASR